jgi:hypothetical protein
MALAAIFTSFLLTLAPVFYLLVFLHSALFLQCMMFLCVCVSLVVRAFHLLAVFFPQTQHLHSYAVYFLQTCVAFSQSCPVFRMNVQFFCCQLHAVVHDALLLLCAVSLCLSCTYSMCAGALHTCAVHFLPLRVSLLFTRLLVFPVFMHWLSVAVLWCLLWLTLLLLFCVPSLTYIFSLLGFDVHRSCTFFDMHPAVHLFSACTQDLQI